MSTLALRLLHRRRIRRPNPWWIVAAVFMTANLLVLGYEAVLALTGDIPAAAFALASACQVRAWWPQFTHPWTWKRINMAWVVTGMGLTTLAWTLRATHG